jgi:flavin reductase (DIM6/NTAB) family NADH-FMN oxidoreductase RutF
MKEIRESEALLFAMEQIPKGAFLTARAGSEKNVMTIGWALFGPIWRKPALLAAVRNSRFTYGILEKAEFFTVSVPAGSREKEIEFCGTRSGKDIDKFRECGFSLLPGPKSGAPLLDIPGFHYDCRIMYKTPMDPAFLAGELRALYPKKDYHTLYFGEILGCYRKE